MTTTPAPTTARPLTRRVCKHAKRIGVLTLVVGVTLGVLLYTGVLDIGLNDEIRARVQSKIAAKYPYLIVKVEAAQLVAGEGIRIRGLSIRDPKSEKQYAEMVYVDEIMAACNTNLQELLTHEPHITCVTIRRPTVRATKRGDGVWNVATLLPRDDRFAKKLHCPITVEGAILEICDPAHNADHPLVFKNLDLIVAPDDSAEAKQYLPERKSEAPLKVTGALACDHFRKLSVEGWYDLVGGVWAVRGEVDKFLVSPALEDSLPLAIPTRVLSLHDLHGKLSVAFEATNQAVAPNSLLPIRFEAAGELSEAKLADPRLPQPLTELSAQMHANETGVALTDIAGKCGTAKLAMKMQRHGWSAAAPLDLKGRVEQLALDTNLADALDERQRVLWDRFLPSGAAHVDFDLAFDGVAWRHDITGELLDVSVAFDKFPYRVTGAGGKVRCTNRTLTMNTFATAGGQRVTCVGEVTDPGPDFTGWLEIASDGPLPIDERLLLAMDEKTQGIVRALEPRGAGTFRFRLDRPDAEQKALPYLQVALQDCALRYEKFRYPVDAISGIITWQNGDWFFEKFSGANDNAVIQASGGVAKDRRGERVLHLDFICADVPLEDDLKRALPPKMQALWVALAPSGTLDSVTAAIDYNCDRRLCNVDVQGQKFVKPAAVDTKAISFEPAAFAFRFDRVTGAFHYQNGDIRLSNIKAQHDRTTFSADALVQLNPDGGWHVTVERCHADRLEVDHRLLSALPAKASDFLGRIKLAGPLHISGSGALASDGRTPGITSANWDVTLDLENGSLHAGAPLEHVHGGLRLVGGMDEQGYASQGELAIDSVMASGIQFTQVVGPLSFDSKQFAFGSAAQQPPTKNRVPRNVTAKACGGTIASDGIVTLDEEGAFSIQAQLKEGNLASIAAETASPRSKLTGKADGFIRLAGTRKGKHTWTGNGAVRLRDADIYELPVMVALLKLLSIREPDKTAFTTADLDYRIQGEHIYLDRLDFHGDAITLKGSGEMDWQKRLNLQFYTMVGRDNVQIPVLRPLLGEASKNLMLITVGGTLDAPDLHREAFPGLNETLQQIFAEK